ncbi:MAG: energy transducer TonB [Edaphobacter sp.]|uniref:energy transducer TonB family protein n=1 Tax=Edaphobacter sp. TaxID=1934404 RepID=UPI0023960AA6|nr:energy transducer TonB [Edaphobacter sp.]MDE1176424.1 energy transducer TonB [Edaphobacter sp.]
MPSLETPPNSAPSTPPSRVRTNRYGDLEEHELIHLLDALDDERAKARFRESVYISVIIWLAIGWFVLYGPQVIFHQPRLINPADVLKQRDKELTYLDMPKDIGKQLPKKPTNVMSDKDRVQQTAKPTLDKKTLEQLQAMRRAGAPGAQATTPTPQPPAPEAAPQQAQPQQAQQQPAPQPLQQHAPQQQAMVDSPHPAPTKPNFGGQSMSAGDAIRQAAQAAAQNRGGGGDYGASIPVAHQGLNTGVDILSDTMGVDFNPYLRRILHDIYVTWLPLIPEEARPPLNKSGETLIRFSILPDGRIGIMRLDGSTQDQALDRAAWGSITGVGQFPPLPKEFHGPNLELRIHYLVNKKPPE